MGRTDSGKASKRFLRRARVFFSVVRWDWKNASKEEWIEKYRTGNLPNRQEWQMLFYGKRGTVDAFTAAAAAQTVGESDTTNLGEANQQRETGGELYVVGGPACKQFGVNGVGIHRDGNTVFVFGSTAPETGP